MPPQEHILHPSLVLRDALLSVTPQLQASKPVCMFTQNLKLQSFYQREAGESAGFPHDKAGDGELSKQGNVTRMKDLSAACGYLIVHKLHGVLYWVCLQRFW